MARTLVLFATVAALIGVAGCVERVEHEAPRARAAERTKVIHEHHVVHEKPVVIEEMDDPAFEGSIDVGNAHGTVRIPDVDVQVNDQRR